MDSFGVNHHIIELSKEEDLPLDKVLKPRQTGKKLPQELSNQQEKNGNIDSVKKNKPIIKEQKDQKPKEQKEQKVQNLPQVNSTQIVKQLILDEKLSMKQAQELLIKLKNIKSLKYDKLSERIRENLIEVRFKNSYSAFIKILQAYSREVGSTHLLHSIFHGFELAWRSQKFEYIETFDDFLRVYLEKVPNCLNKRFAKWMKERLMVSNNRSIYTELRKKILEIVKGVVNRNRRQNGSQNEKIIGLVIYFQLWDSIDMKQLVKIVPLQKINEYIDNDQVIRQKFQLDQNKNSQKIQQQKMNKTSQQRKESSQQSSNEKNNKNKVPSLVHQSILQLIRLNNLKQVQKILKSYRVSHLLYPQFVHKLQMKYLEYAQRTNPIYVLDQLVHGKVNLVEGLIDIYIRKRKYDHVDHFTHKYKLRGIDKPDSNKIFVNPLKHQDSFGPTESHVLNQRPQTYFLRLLDFQVPKSNVIWIDTITIFQKPFTSHLKKLLFSKEIGLDSESTSAIHVFEKARLELIQIYEPESNVILLFDVRDFKNDKKKRNRKNNTKQTVKKQSNSQKLNNTKPVSQQNKELGKSFTQPIQLIQLEEDNKNNIQQSNQKDVRMLSNQQNIPFQTSMIQSQKLQEQNKAWYRFTKIIENVFRNSTIYGHVLHSDLGQIISELNLTIKANKLKIKDSQTQFKKYYPQQTKSKLSFLAQKCFGKEISKFQQCGAWDKRPLRNAQKHYAALDAVLPYKLVKLMEEKFNKQTN